MQPRIQIMVSISISKPWSGLYWKRTTAALDHIWALTRDPGWHRHAHTQLPTHWNITRKAQQHSVSLALSLFLETLKKVVSKQVESNVNESKHENASVWSELSSSESADVMMKLSQCILMLRWQWVSASWCYEDIESVHLDVMMTLSVSWCYEDMRYWVSMREP